MEESNYLTNKTFLGKDGREYNTLQSVEEANNEFDGINSPGRVVKYLLHGDSEKDLPPNIRFEKDINPPPSLKSKFLKPFN